MKSYSIPCALAASAFVAGNSMAADVQRAVSAPNLAVAPQFGVLNGEATGMISATASAPIGNQFGVQVDGLYARNTIDYYGIGGHFFYRDPKKFLLGTTAMTSKTGNTEFNRFGVEAEIYLDKFTFSPAAGYQDGDSRMGNSAFYDVSASYYAQDNMKVTLGSTGFAGVRVGYGAAEWQPQADRPLTVFANAGGGNEGKAFAMFGARYTFGAPNSTIKHRDRTGDPANIVKNALDYTGSAINAKGSVAPAAVVSSTTPPPTSPPPTFPPPTMGPFL